MEKRKTEKDSFAIIGMGCRFPGGGESPKDFWEMLLNKTDAIKDIPKERWDKDAYYHPNYKVHGKMKDLKRGTVLFYYRSLLFNKNRPYLLCVKYTLRFSTR